MAKRSAKAAKVAKKKPAVKKADEAKEKESLAVLRSDAPAADKAIACKKLAIYGSSASVGDLAKLLPDPQLSSWTRIALEAIPGPEADEALRGSNRGCGNRHDALDHADWVTKMEDTGGWA